MVSPSSFHSSNALLRGNVKKSLKYSWAKSMRRVKKREREREDEGGLKRYLKCTQQTGLAEEQHVVTNFLQCVFNVDGEIFALRTSEFLMDNVGE